MIQTANSKYPNVFPYLRYRNAPAAIEWLKSVFGMQEHEIIANEDGTIAHAELQLGPGMVMLGSARHDDLRTKTPVEADGVTQTIYVSMDQVDDHYALAKSKGAAIVRELSDTDYGSREYTARDLEGNIWSFGTYNPYSG